MKKYFKILSILNFITISIFVSCEKEITVDIPLPEEKIVVEGHIEQWMPDYSFQQMIPYFPYVILTKNVPYFSAVDSATLSDLVIRNATVIVSVDSIIDTLKGQEFFYEGYTGCVYLPSNPLSPKIIGEVGKTYNLKVIIGDTLTLTASTTIPPLVVPDSLWSVPESDYGDTLFRLWGRFIDPPETRNFYRIFTKVLGEDDDFLPVMYSTTDDEFFNGLTFEFPIERGLKSTAYNEEDFDISDFFFKKGDTVVFKLCTIDQQHYEFWKTALVQMTTGAGPFASPTTIKTNIQGGLGIWGGYGATYDTIVIQ